MEPPVCRLGCFYLWWDSSWMEHCSMKARILKWMRRHCSRLHLSPTASFHAYWKRHLVQIIISNHSKCEMLWKKSINRLVDLPLSTLICILVLSKAHGPRQSLKLCIRVLWNAYEENEWVQGLWGLSSGGTRERGAGVLHYMLTSPTYGLIISCGSQASWENEDRGTEEEKVFVVASQCCDVAASALCVTWVSAWLMSPRLPWVPSHRDNTDQYTMKARSGAPCSRPL